MRENIEGERERLVGVQEIDEIEGDVQMETVEQKDTDGEEEVGGEVR